jgi:hypothetical protein
VRVLRRISWGGTWKWRRMTGQSEWYIKLIEARGGVCVCVCVCVNVSRYPWSEISILHSLQVHAGPREMPATSSP